jgi:hypothetical protein
MIIFQRASTNVIDFTSRKAGKGPEKPKDKKIKGAESSAIFEKLCGGDRRGIVCTDNHTGESVRCRGTEQSHHSRNDWNGQAGLLLESKTIPEFVGHAGSGGL